MTQSNNLTAQPLPSGSMVKRMAIGWGIGLMVILFFVLGVDEPNPAWPKYWMIRSLVITPLAGAAAGLIFHFLERFRKQTGFTKIAAWVASIFAYIVGIWLGTVLGLDGTMWN